MGSETKDSWDTAADGKNKTDDNSTRNFTWNYTLCKLITILYVIVHSAHKLMALVQVTV